MTTDRVEDGFHAEVELRVDFLTVDNVEDVRCRGVHIADLEVEPEVVMG